MNILMISYDLNQPGQDYSKAKEIIESLGVYCHFLESTYLVKTVYSSEDAAKQISQAVDPSDRFIVCQVEKPIKGWLSTEQWDWISKNL